MGLLSITLILVYDVRRSEISRNYKISDQTDLELGLDDAYETGATLPNVGMVNAGVKVARLETPDKPEAVSEEDFRIDEYED